MVIVISQNISIRHILSLQNCMYGVLHYYNETTLLLGMRVNVCCSMYTHMDIYLLTISVYTRISYLSSLNVKIV